MTLRSLVPFGVKQSVSTVDSLVFPNESKALRRLLVAVTQHTLTEAKMRRRAPMLPGAAEQLVNRESVTLAGEPAEPQEHIIRHLIIIRSFQTSPRIRAHQTDSSPRPWEYQRITMATIVLNGNVSAPLSVTTGMQHHKI